MQKGGCSMAMGYVVVYSGKTKRGSCGDVTTRCGRFFQGFPTSISVIRLRNGSIIPLGCIANFHTTRSFDRRRSEAAAKEESPISAAEPLLVLQSDIKLNSGCSELDSLWRRSFYYPPSSKQPFIRIWLDGG
jgi:hypothetical protein